jgi:hypothetical protein
MDDTKFSGILKEIIAQYPNIKLTDFLADRLQLPIDKAEELARRIKKAYLTKDGGLVSSTPRPLLEKPVDTESTPKEAVYALDRLCEKEFETFSKWLFEELGYEIHPEKHAVKGGVDFTATKDNQKILLQARRYSKGYMVSETIVSLAQRAQDSYGCSHCIVLATTYFSEQAASKAQASGIELWDTNAITCKITQAKDKADLDGQSCFQPFAGSLLQSLLRIGETKDFMIESRAGEKYDLYLTGIKYPLLTIQTQSNVAVKCISRIKYFEPMSENDGEALFTRDFTNSSSDSDDVAAYTSIIKYLEEFLD